MEGQEMVTGRAGEGAWKSRRAWRGGIEAQEREHRSTGEGARKHRRRSMEAQEREHGRKGEGTLKERRGSIEGKEREH